MVKTHGQNSFAEDLTDFFGSLAYTVILTDTTLFFCPQLKNTIIDQMSTVEVTSIEQVTQMAAVVALATEQKDEISQNSQV